MKSRYPAIKKVDGKVVCRGCGSDIPKGRQTWCSHECYKTRCPQMVIMAVRERDKGICQMCGLETVRRIVWWKDGETAQQQSERRKREKELKAEYDHITPFSEGGETILENMRTLCRKCHKERTAKWRKQKARKDRGIQDDLPTLAPYSESMVDSGRPNCFRTEPKLISPAARQPYLNPSVEPSSLKAAVRPS
jgi:5-methylcytosine-specific restriction enzyme A